MDPKPTVSEGTIINEKKEKKKKSLSYHLFLLSFCSFAFLFFLFVSFFLFFVAGFITVFIENFSIPNSISVAAECKILSTSVDLRSSKVCELGLLNYKAKHVFYSYERTKFRCRYDYYWASVFKVEFKDQSSGLTRRALAESPKEALPLDCRPSFSTALLTKDKFKVNETYNCWYTPSISSVDIFSDSLFNCQAKDPSLVEMIRRYSVLLARIIDSWFSSEGNTKHEICGSVVGILTGMLTSFIVMFLVKLLQRSKSVMSRFWGVKEINLAVYGTYFKRACFLVAYFSFVGWLTIQYVWHSGCSCTTSMYFRCGNLHHRQSGIHFGFWDLLSIYTCRQKLAEAEIQQFLVEPVEWTQDNQSKTKRNPISFQGPLI